MLIHEYLEESAQRYPEKSALIFQNNHYTYHDVDRGANRLSQAFLKAGLCRQDRIAIFLDPCPEAVISIFASLKASGIFTVINPQVRPEKTQYLLNDCQAKILVTDYNHYKELSPVLMDCPELKTVVLSDVENSKNIDNSNTRHDIICYKEIQAKHSPQKPRNQNIDIDLASLIYTSGSTGFPKAVMCTHLNMNSAVMSITSYLENIPDDIILNVLPLSFDYGLYQILMAFRFGGTVVLEKAFIYPYQIIELIQKERVTGFPVVPTIVAILLRLKSLNSYDFSSLRYITNTAQALPTSHIKKLRTIFPGVKIYSMYGLTECKRVSYLPPEELEKRPASVGKAMPNSEAYIVDERGKKITEPGIAGELVVRGANVMKGYWNQPGESEKVFRPGPLPGESVLYTGDLFKMDEEGYLYFISRKDDILKISGEKVSPKEIENVLYKNENIAEAAVVGIADEILGQAAKAFVVLKRGADLTSKEIIKYCSQQLESFMVPKYVVIMEELPKTDHGKIDKKSLARQ